MAAKKYESNAIEFPGYETGFENVWWKKKASPVQGIPAIRVLYIERYNIPTKADVINFIRENARKPAEADLVGLARYFLPQEIKAMADGEEEIINHLGRHCTESNQKGPCILAKSSLLPDFFLEKFNYGLAIFAESYGGGPNLVNKAINTALEGISKNKASVLIVLNKNSALPKRECIDSLLESCVRDSDILISSHELGQYQDVRELVNLLYCGLNSPRKVKKILDGTNNFLKEEAIRTLVEVTMCRSVSKCITGASRNAMATKIADSGSSGKEEGVDLAGIGPLGEIFKDNTPNC